MVDDEYGDNLKITYYDQSLIRGGLFLPTKFRNMLGIDEVNIA